MTTYATPAAGDAAPDFTVETDAGERLTLSSLRGRPVVLYFYPKDDTSGCTTEACEFRDLFPRFAAGDAVVLGVSPDSAASHVKFKQKYGLPFPLLADTDHAVAEAYGVWREKSMYGRKYMGVERTTFVVDRDGRLARVFEKVKPAGHAEAVAAAVAELG
jgi:peroxiredoxin Q/BCP